MYLFAGKDYCICARASNTGGFKHETNLIAPRDAMIRAFGNDEELKHRLEKEEAGGNVCLSMKFAFKRIKEMVETGEIIIEG